MPILVATEGLVITIGQYLLEAKNCELVDSTNYRTQQPEQQLKWTWFIERVMEIDPSPEQQEHVGTEFPEWTSVVCSPNSKSRSRAEALMQRQMALNEEIDTDLLLGRRIKATFETYTRLNGNKGTKNGPVAAYQRDVQVITQRPASADAAQPGLVATPDGPISPPAFAFSPPADPAFTPIFPTDTRPSADLMARLTVAYQAVIGIGKWRAEDVTQLMLDLWGKARCSQLTADQAETLLGILGDRVDVYITPEGKWALGTPF